MSNRIQFSLRTLILAVFTASLLFAWLRHKMHREQEIRGAIRLLENCPGPLSDHFDPVALVRTVNSLHALGKGDAIVAIRRFHDSTHRLGGSKGQTLALDLVIPLLFVPTSRDSPLPGVTVSRDAGRTHLCLRQLQVSIVVQDDLPFLISPPGARIVRPDRTALIEWAYCHGRLREMPLRPTDDPFSAAELLRRRYNDELLDSCQDQAMRAIATFVDAPPRFVTQQEWDYYKSRAGAVGVRWDVARQKYAASRSEDR